MKRIFVSSTFKDMHGERDLLKNTITPLINNKLKQYGEDIDFIDLRWGINTSEMEDEESSKKILKVCLDEIDESRPYVIVFVGDRYGWIPPSSLIDETLKNKDINDIANDISVTNLEIEYSVFNKNNDDTRPLFYFRSIKNKEKMSEEEKKIYDIESPMGENKLKQLKEKIEALYPERVRHYELTYNELTHKLEGYDTLLKKLEDDVQKMLEEDLIEFSFLYEYEKIEILSKSYFEKYFDSYVTKSVQDVSLPNVIFEDEYRNSLQCDVIVGENGSGRRTTLAMKYQASLKEANTINICYVHGLDGHTDFYYSFMYFLLEKLKEILGRDDFIDEEGFSFSDASLSTMAKLFDEVSELEDVKVRFFVMNADNSMLEMVKAIESKMSELNEIAFYFEMNEPLVSPLPFALRNHITKMEGLTKDEIDGVIQNILKKKHKQLPNSIINEIKKKKGATSPLYLSLLIERILLFNANDFKEIKNIGDGMDAIEKYTLEVVKNTSDDLCGLTCALLKDIIKVIDDPFIIRLIGVLSNDGVNANENLGIGFDKDQLERLFNYHHWDFSELSYSLFLHLVPAIFNMSSDNVSILAASKDILQAMKLVSKDNYLKEIIEWLENETFEEDEDDDHAKLILPYLYYRNNDVDAFLNKYLESLEQYENKIDDIEALGSKASNDVVYFSKKTNPFMFLNAIGYIVYRQPEFVLELEKRIIEKVRSGEISDITPIISYHFNYMDLTNGSFDEKMKRIMIKHYFSVLRLYFDLYQKNHNNYNIHLLFQACVSQVGLLTSDGSLIDISEEDKEFFAMVNAEIQKPEEIKFAESITNEQYVKSMALKNILGFYRLYTNLGPDSPFLMMYKGQYKETIEKNLSLGRYSSFKHSLRYDEDLYLSANAICLMEIALYMLLCGDETDYFDEMMNYMEQGVNYFHSFLVENYLSMIGNAYTLNDFLINVAINITLSVYEKYEDIIARDKIYDLTDFLLFLVCIDGVNTNHLKALLSGVNSSLINLLSSEILLIHDYLLDLCRNSNDLSILVVLLEALPVDRKSVV